MQRLEVDKEDHRFEGCQWHILKPSQKRKRDEGGEEMGKKEKEESFILLHFCVNELSVDSWLTLNNERTEPVVCMHPSL